MQTEPTRHKLIGDRELAPVLNEVVDTLGQTGIAYLFGGGLAAKCFGRERLTKDIDLFVRPENADKLLEALEKAGFKTQKTDPKWLYKAKKDDIPIDIIFKSAGNIFLDDETFKRATPMEFMGRPINILPPEDLIIMKSLATGEFTPNHWYDALDVIKSTPVDWDYLKRRAKHGPRRVLSLLFYAQSVDLPVPDRVVSSIFQTYLK